MSVLAHAQEEIQASYDRLQRDSSSEIAKVRTSMHVPCDAMQSAGSSPLMWCTHGVATHRLRTRAAVPCAICAHACRLRTRV